MQAVGLGVATLLGAGSGKYLSSGESDTKNTSFFSRSKAQQPTVISVSSSNDGTSGLSQLLFAGALGAGAVMVLGGFQWLRRDDAAKRLQPHLKKLEKAALKQVRRADLNSSDRDRRLDRNSKLRMNKMQSEIVGESRGNFAMLNQQINCLTQIALQTLTQMAKPNTAGGEGMDEAIERDREKILEWTRSAQREADKFMDHNTINNARRSYVSQLRAEIPGLRTSEGEEAQEEELLSIGPHELRERPEKSKVRNDGQYKTVGMSCLGFSALLYSVYMFAGAGKQK